MDSMFNLVINKLRNGMFPEIARIDELGDVRGGDDSVVFVPNKRRKVVVGCSGFVVCQTQVEQVNRILGWLNDDTITSVGIYGMGGVGKTTIAKLLYARLGSTEVGWVSVDPNFDIFQLQQNVADTFGIDILHDKDLDRRAAILSASLSCLGKSILILDDVWSDFCREEVGIPNDCTLVLITRTMDVCRLLGCQRLIKVCPLPEEDSWLLFTSTLQCGAKLDSKQILGIARKLCRQCGGLPLAITALATYLRGVTDEFGWSKALKHLTRLPLGLPCLGDTFVTLTRSYDSLSNDKLKSCWLYCALFPEGYGIRKEELIRLWIAESLIDDVESSRAMNDMGHSILHKLLSSCLLESSKEKTEVKMHQLARDLALSIAGDSFMVKSGLTLSEMSTDLVWNENLHVVSLMNAIPGGVFDTSLKCPTLSTLLLQHNNFLELPDTFFAQMPTLRTLNLSHTCIKTLPSSISTLHELQVLDVSFCVKLRHVPSLAKLQKLQFLDLSHTAISRIPCSFDTSSMLRELNLSAIPDIINVPKGMLPALSRLKRLSCDVVGTLAELLSLKSLEALEARFPSLKDLSTYVRSQRWRTLECFYLQAGRNIGIERPSYSKLVSLNNCSLKGEGEDYVVLPDNIHELFVEDCTDFKNLSDIMNTVDVRSQRNSEICTPTSEIEQGGAFSSLERCRVSRCHGVETLFRSGWVQHLRRLQLLEVEDCGKLKELICEEGEETHSLISLPQLKRLVLTVLPQLNFIYRGRLMCASLHSLSVMDCLRLKRIPFVFRESNPFTLKLIQGQEQWWEMLEWDYYPDSQTLFKPLLRCQDEGVSMMNQ